MDKYGTVEDHIEPLDDGIYYMVEDVEKEIADLKSVIEASFAQTDDVIKMLKSYL